MTAADAQGRVQAPIDRRVASGDEVGVQVAVVEHGRVVVDAVSGAADPDRAQGPAVAPGTLFFAASTAKGVASAVAHVLVERGELDYDLRAVEVWPEFGAHGKDRVTLRHVLLHTAGVPAPPYDTTVEELCDWEHMCAVLAEAEPSRSGSATRSTSACPGSCWTGWPAPSHRPDRRPRRPSRDRRSTGRSLPASGPTPTTPTVGTSSPPTSPRRAP
jgi:CubicO group peptidase (beta-lactamase class C family)